MAPDEQTLIVPLDGSRNAETAFPIALDLARRLDAELRCVRVEPPAADDAERARRSGEFESYVTGLLNLHQGFGIRCAATVREGEPAEEILAASRRARLIVLASHGEGGLRSALWGSVADRVARSATVPVLVVSVRGNQHLTDGPILVALDRSHAGEAGLAFARELSGTTHLPLVLMNAWDPVPPPGIEFVPNAERVAKEHAAESDAYLERMHRPGEEFVAVTGPALPAIRQAADRLDASIVVLTSHGKRLGSRITLGSTTEAVRHTVTRPILIVPVEAGRDGHEPGEELPPAQAHR